METVETGFQDRPGRKCGWLLVLLLARSLFALNPHLPASQYLHTSWTQEEGNALPEILSLSQTPDGYLWLGSTAGLMRFDGMRFTAWSAVSGSPLPYQSIGWLRQTKGSAVWAVSSGGSCLISRGRASCFPTAGKMPCPLIASVTEDASGSVWLLGGCPDSSTLALLAPDGNLRIFGTGEGLPSKKVRSLLLGPDGSLWLATTDSVCRWSPGIQAQCTKGPPLNVPAMAEDLNGHIVFADPEHRRLVRISQGLDVSAGPSFPNSALSRAILCDRDGNIWIGTMGEGLLRIQGDRVERLTHDQGLSNNVVNALLEDSEGDIWVGTARGIDRLRDPAALLYNTQKGLSSDLISSVSAGQDGTIWIGTGAGLNRLRGGRIDAISGPAGFKHESVLSTFEDSTGRLWVATVAGLAMRSGDRYREILTADGRHLQQVFNIAGDRRGTIWVTDTKLGVLTVRNGVAYPGPVVVPPGDAIAGMLVTRNGDVWLGHFRGGITIICSHSTKHFDNLDGVAPGPVRDLYEGRDGTIWAGTGGGLSRFRDSHWISWSSAQGLPEGGVLGVVEDDASALWVFTPTTVARLMRANLDGPPKPLQPVYYAQGEGLRLSSAMSHPRIARSPDGRIWVCTEDGLAAIDPVRASRKSFQPPVAIEQVVADGKTADPYQESETGFRGHNLQIVYTGISLRAPEQLLFRYRLKGLENQWNDAGTRRSVAYVNLPPGHYHFQLIADNRGGLWNGEAADFALRVDPYFYQTTWFLIVCVIGALLAVWSVHRLRVRTVVSRMELVAAERVRFSRELHDSLLQGFSGVVFLLEAAAQQFEKAPEISKQRLNRAIEQADQSLREAREMIGNMRIPALEKHTLPEALHITGKQMVSGTEVEFQFALTGRVQAAPYNVQANLFLLAREAVRNALKHAAATTIRLELCFTPKELLLTVQDNGIGFDTEMANSKTGHYGFHGMRERARAIGATITVNSTPGQGSSIAVSVPWKRK